jgi:hypothetical protein
MSQKSNVPTLPVCKRLPKVATAKRDENQYLWNILNPLLLERLVANPAEIRRSLYPPLKLPTAGYLSTENRPDCMNLRTNLRIRCLNLAAARPYLPEDPIGSDKSRIINDYTNIYLRPASKFSLSSRLRVSYTGLFYCPLLTFFFKKNGLFLFL